MKKTAILILSVAVSLGMVSCVKDYTERNTNQEQANEEMMDHDNMRTGSYISQMIANVLPSYQNDGSNEYGSASYQVVQGLTGSPTMRPLPTAVSTRPTNTTSWPTAGPRPCSRTLSSAPWLPGPS